jgi:hypothetical protein
LDQYLVQPQALLLHPDAQLIEQTKLLGAVSLLSLYHFSIRKHKNNYLLRINLYMKEQIPKHYKFILQRDAKKSSMGIMLSTMHQVKRY